MFRRAIPLPAVTDCESIPFEPSLQVEPTSHKAGEPTGLSAKLKIPQTNSVNLPATSPAKDVKVTLPEGMTIASGAADGLEGCSASQVGYSAPMSIEEEEANPPGEAHCPQASKIGTATFVSPALSQPLHGAVYQRAPGEQPYLGAHSAGEGTQLFGMWLVSDELGTHIKIPGVIEANQQTGQITTTFTGLPQLPVEEVDLELKGGPRAPLRNPQACGSFDTSYEMTPWSGNAPVSGQSQMQVTEGCAAPGFAPKLSAGATNPTAGAFSPFTMTLTQESGEQNLSGLSVKMPPGLVAKLAGVGQCGGAALSTGDCPASSQVGAATVAAGPGPAPLWIPQSGKSPTAVYLAGPYKQAPYSLLVKVPAQAGPFDLGNVLTRVALDIDPKTAQVTAASDSLPQILQGVPVQYRTVNVRVDRSQFTLDPTNCEAMSVTGTATSAQGTKASLSNRFQVADCAQLAFKPQIALRLKGGTKRTAHPKLIAEVHSKGIGVANLARTQVKLPSSAFLDQAHIRTVCTRVQFAAGGGNGEKCPKGSIYGKAWVKSPLFDYWLSGNAYLRSSNHKLPDLVLALSGPPSAPVHIELDGKTDSVHGALRNTFEAVPDAPFNKARVVLFGGKRGLVVNSRDLCAAKQRANVRMVGQNGAAEQLHPLVKASCGAAGKKKHKKHSKSK